MSSSAFVSPRKRAVEYMLQFCKEHGLDRTYETLVEEFESAQDFIELESKGGPVPFAGLETAVEVYDTLKATQSTSTVRDFAHKIESILSTRLSEEPEISEMRLSVSGLHSSNIISVAASPAITTVPPVAPEDPETTASASAGAYRPDVVATAAADRSLKISSLETGEVLLTLTDYLPAVGLSMEWNPKPSVSGQDELLIGCLNGEVKLLRLSAYSPSIVSGSEIEKKKPTPCTFGSGLILEEVGSWKTHTKYVVATRWVVDGAGFATASHDGTVAFFKPIEDGSYKHFTSLTFKGQVECLERIYFDESYNRISDSLKASPNSFICGVRDDNLLHILDFDSGIETDAVNMNMLGDDYVSFVPLSLACSRTGMMLLVATDHHRVMCFHLPSKKQVRNYYGARNDGFSTPRVVWIGSTPTRPAVTTQDNDIHIWDADKQTTSRVIKAHNLRVRDLTLGPNSNELITVSLDKSLRIWGESKK